jgi:hypothetical protein
LRNHQTPSRNPGDQVPAAARHLFFIQTFFFFILDKSAKNTELGARD